MDRVFGGSLLAKGRIPRGQRVHRLFQAVAQVVGRLDQPEPFGGGLKAAHRFGPDGKEIGLRGFIKPDLNRPILIGGVPWFEKLLDQIPLLEV